MKKLLKMALVLFCAVTAQTNIFCMLRGSGQLAMRAAMTRAATPQTKNQVAKFVLRSSQSHDNPWDLGTPEMRSAQLDKDTDKKEKEKIEKLQAIAMNADFGQLNKEISEKRKFAATVLIVGPAIGCGMTVIGSNVLHMLPESRLGILGTKGCTISDFFIITAETVPFCLTVCGLMVVPLIVFPAAYKLFSDISDLKQKRRYFENQIAQVKK